MRALPWRETKDPYIIWISEIIMQQTRVNQGLPYFLKFIEEFPDVIALANASEQKVLKLWQGLGYYSRARNLHYTAKYIRDHYDGIFPSDPAQIAALKGVGEYTTAAVASFAFGHPLAVVDGNVVRLLSRFFNIDIPFDSNEGKKIFRQIALEQLDKKNPGIYNQAVMEFGAIQCKPVNPDCKSCPLNAGCLAFRLNKISELPVKKKQASVKKRLFNYLVNTDKDKIYIQQRKEKDIWQNLYEFPLIESEKPITGKKLSEQIKSNVRLLADYSHKLSHRDIHARFWLVEDLKEQYLTKDNMLITKAEHLHYYPVSRLMERFLEDFNYKKGTD